MYNKRYEHIFRKCFWFLPLAVLITAQSCTSSSYISVNSQPYGATVVAADIVVGTTPALLQFEKADSILIRVEKDGYSSQEFMLRNQRDWSSVPKGLLVGAASMSLSYLLFLSPMYEQAEEMALSSYGLYTVSSLTWFAIAGKKLGPSTIDVNLEPLPQVKDSDNE